MTAILILVIFPSSFLIVRDSKIQSWSLLHGTGFRGEPGRNLQLTSAAKAFLVSRESAGRRLYFARLSLVAFALSAYYLIFSQSLPAFAPYVREPEQLTTLALLVVFLIGGHVLTIKHLNRVTECWRDHGMRRGGLYVWLAMVLFGGLVEEAWRATSIFALSQTLNLGAGIAIAAVVGTLCHTLGNPSRIPGVREEVLWDLATGAGCGVLLILFRGVAVPVLLNLVYNLATLTAVRGTLTPSSAES